MTQQTSKQKKIRPPVKTHGGKYYLTDFVISNFPENYTELVYCEPFCAGASIFLNKQPSSQEVINDIDQGMIYVHKVLRDDPKEFIDRVKRIRYTERAFKMALKKSTSPFEDYMDHAVNEYVLRRMSRGGMKKAFAWSDRKRGGKAGDVNAWETMIKMLPAISTRLQGATILCKDYVQIIKTWDEANTLMYLDPPYMHATRTDTSTYEHELTDEDHLNLLHLAKNMRGKVIISGYSNQLYNRNLKGWRVKKKNVPNNSGQGKAKDRRIEMLWMNY